MYQKHEKKDERIEQKSNNYYLLTCVVQSLYYKQNSKKKHGSKLELIYKKLISFIGSNYRMIDTYQKNHKKFTT